MSVVAAAFPYFSLFTQTEHLPSIRPEVPITGDHLPRPGYKEDPSRFMAGGIAKLRIGNYQSGQQGISSQTQPLGLWV